MESQLRSDLLKIAAAYGKATGAALSSVARRCRNDSAFFQRIADTKKSFTARTFDEVMQWFSGNWPADTAWPLGISRPPANAPKSPSADSTADRASRSDQHPTPDTARSLVPGEAGAVSARAPGGVDVESSSQDPLQPAPIGAEQLCSDVAKVSKAAATAG